MEKTAIVIGIFVWAGLLFVFFGIVHPAWVLQDGNVICAFGGASYAAGMGWLMHKRHPEQDHPNPSDEALAVRTQRLGPPSKGELETERLRQLLNREIGNRPSRD